MSSCDGPRAAAFDRSVEVTRISFRYRTEQMPLGLLACQGIEERPLVAVHQLLCYFLGVCKYLAFLFNLFFV